MPSVHFIRVPIANCAARRRLFAVAVAMFVGLLLVVAVPAARADTILVKSAELRVEDGEVLLNAEFDLSLNATFEEALHKGIPLYFVLEFELTRNRWYWLDEKVGQTTLTYRVSYNALTRQYRAGSGLLMQAFGSLEEAERYVGRGRRVRLRQPPRWRRAFAMMPPSGYDWTSTSCPSPSR